jgi:DNA modification methylase
MKRSGGVGLCDFRGTNIRLGERAGLVYEYDWSVRKNPQSQAIRTRSRELQFAGLESDRAKQRGTLQDYLIKFRKPGENAVPIDAKNQVSRNDWIKWAEGCWDDVHETDTLNTAAAKSEDDTRHICPLQLEVIRRCVLLYSNPGEIVFSPFTGIGSEGFMSLGGRSPKTGKQIADPRRFYGCELKEEYYHQALKNLTLAESQSKSASQMDLFAGVTA